jgi:hypothetical protein
MVPPLHSWGMLKKRLLSLEWAGHLVRAGEVE